MKKKTATYTFRVNYDNNNHVVVELNINYALGGYSITPRKGTSFIFSEKNSNSKRWKAVTQAINIAIDFATEELKQ